MIVDVEAEARQDEEILARIVATAERERIPLGSARGWGIYVHLDGDRIDVERRQPDGPCCAVGCGLLYRGSSPPTSTSTGAAERVIEAFARMHEVSIDYAVGVSDGFETAIALEFDREPSRFSAFGGPWTIEDKDRERTRPPDLRGTIEQWLAWRDYYRGFAVGSGVWMALADEAPLPRPKDLLPEEADEDEEG